MRVQALKLYQRFTALPEIWPGWQHPETPVAFFTPEEAVLLGHPEPPAEFAAENVNGILAYYARPAPSQFVANTAINLNGHKTATVMWSTRSQDAALALLVHEAFHAYQQEQRFPIAALPYMMCYPAYDPVINALGEVEAQLLYETLICKDDAAVLVKHALDARAARQLLLREMSQKCPVSLPAEPGFLVSRNLAEYEDYNEMHEGLAVYTEMQVLQPGDSRWEGNMNALQRLNHDGWGAERLRFYYSGMAYGMLCDRYAAGWQEQVLKLWSPPALILAEALSYQPDPENRHFADIDFAALLHRHRQTSEERCSRMSAELEHYLRPGGINVKVSFSANPVNGAWNPNTSQLLPDGGRLHCDLLMYAYPNTASIRVEHGTIEREFCRAFEYQKPGLTITVNGKPVSEGTHCGAISITGKDSRLVVPNGRLEFNGKECRVFEL